MKYLILLSILWMQNSWAVSKVQPDFAEPYTGKPVKSYTIKLPVSRQEKQPFSIPGDCSSINGKLLEGAGNWGSSIERRLWMKVDDDCRYQAFLNHSGNSAQHDLVSQYDFFNADVSDLPLRPGCTLNMFITNPGSCPPKMPGFPDFEHFVNSHDREHNSSHDDCRFHQGVFRGHIVYDAFGMHCVSSKHAPGFRILSVDFADVNGDNYQDAILRLIPIGPGVSPAPRILPLTRTKEEEKKFSIPQGTPFPALGPASVRN